MPDDLQPEPAALAPRIERRAGRHRWRALVAGGLLLAAAVTVLAFWRLQPPRVSVVHARRGEAIEAVYATGTVEPTIMLPIAARMTARLVQLDADEGDRVQAGQELARLEDTDLASNLAQLRSQEAFARAEYNRYAALLPRGVIARTQYDQARATWLSARSAAARAAAELRFARLLAPTAATVIRRDGEVGQLVTAGQPVFWLAVDSPPRISAEVDEENIVRVRPGQAVLIRADAFPGRVFDGRVRSVTPKGDPTARSYRVRIAIDGATPLQVGMTTEVNVIVQRHPSALLVPDTALDGERVWLVRGGRLEPSHVDVGIRGERQVEITAGLADGDRVAISPQDWMRAGRAVRAQDASGSRP